MNDRVETESPIAEDRCAPERNAFLSAIDAGRDPLANPALAEHAKQCAACANEWSELREFESRAHAAFRRTESLPVPLRARFIAAQRRAQAASTSAGNRAFQIRAPQIRAPQITAGSPEPRGALDFSRLAASLLLVATVGLLATILGSLGPSDGEASLSLVRIERSGEGTLRPGEAFRLRAVAPTAGLLTVVVNDGESVELVFPHRVLSHQTLPQEGSVRGEWSFLGHPGPEVSRGEALEIPHPSFGDFTAAEVPRTEVYYLFVRPTDGVRAPGEVESMLRTHFDPRLEPDLRTIEFERWLGARFGSVDRVSLRVE